MMPGSGAVRPSRSRIRSLAVVTSLAQSLDNFRGPLIREIVRRGVEVYAVAPDFRPETRRRVAALGAEPVDCSMDRTGRNPLRDALDVVRLAGVLRQLAPDATLAYFAKPVIYGSIAARLVGIPTRFALIAGAGYVFTEAGDEGQAAPGATALRILTERLYRLSLSGVDRVFVQNPDDEELFVRHGLADAEKVLRLPGTGVDLETFRPVRQVRRPVTFLLAARLLIAKGIREYVRAARRVQEEYPDATFRLVGDTDPNPDSLPKQEIREWVEEGVIDWPGWVDDVRPWMAETSVYVLPSYYREGIPRSVQEAMAMARPVITTDAPGCRETVVPGENGFLVPPRDVDALVEAMTHFIEDRDLIVRMGRRSRELAERRFNVHDVNDRMLAAMGIPETPDRPESG